MKIRPDEKGELRLAPVWRAVAVVSLLLALVGGAQGAAAQDVSPFRLEDISGVVELGFLTSLEDRTRTVSQRSNFDRIEFSQLLDLDFDAYIYHPRFLTFQGGFQFEAIEGVAGTGGTRLLVGGDWRFDFLREYRDTLSIYGKIRQAEVERPFSETYEVMTELYGTTLTHRWGWLPFALSYQHQSVDGGRDESFDDVSDEVRFRGSYNLGERSSGRVDYTLVFRDQDGDDSRREALNLNNTSYFGDESEKRWSTFIWLTEDNDFDQEYAASGSTELYWQHTEDFSTRYLLTSHWEDSDDRSLWNVGPSIILRHELYESLTTQLNLFGRYEDASYGSMSEVGSRAFGQYLKKLADFGRLSIRVAPRVVMTSTRPDQERASVTDESHVMLDAQPVLLRQRNIIVSSIVVTNLDGTIEYDPGPAGDYLITETDGGFEVELVRTIFSTIGDGEVVLVDYEYELVSKSDILTTGVDTSLDLWFFEHLGLFARYDNSDQKVLSGDRGDLLLNSYDREVAGIELRWPWFDAKAQYENYDATFGPYDGFQTSLSVFTYGNLSWRARANAGYSLRNRKDSGQTITRVNFGLGSRAKVFRRGVFEIEGRYLRERRTKVQGDANDFDSLDLRSSYSWWYAKVQVTLEGRVAQYFREAEDRRVYQVNLTARRSF